MSSWVTIFGSTVSLSSRCDWPAFLARGCISGTDCCAILTSVDANAVSKPCCVNVEGGTDTAAAGK